MAIAGPKELMNQYRALGVVVCEDVDRGMQAIAALLHFGRSFETSTSWPGLPTARDVGLVPREEYAAKQLLAMQGIPCLPEAVVERPEEVEDAAQAIGGPVVVKVLSPDIAHKTEVGGVAINLPTPAEAAKAAWIMDQRVRSQLPQARITGYLVAPMCKGIEVICGAVTDPTFGPIVMVGFGGVHAELFNDVAFRLAPLGVDEAMSMIDELKMRPLLNGLRGALPVDVEALALTLSRLSMFIVSAREQIAAIDINPFVLLPQGEGGFALDALIIPVEKEESR
jgi:acyl-CoA synthetase (NDP forming)